MKLLSSCSSGGCGAKIGPDELAEYLRQMPGFNDPDLLVGFGGSDDAAVYRLSPELALVSTVDFFPPMVDDPHLFGRIAAANALSDVYAMGGRPIMALNLVTFPQKAAKEALGEILRGGAEKVQEAGAVIGGGHSIYDHEPKYGLAVTGLVRPDRIWRNNTPAAGDVLLLTKPLGSGLVMAAYRAGLAGSAEFQAAAAVMERLNRYAADRLRDFPINAVTDVTGFGLAAHALEMAGEDQTLVIDLDSLPLLPGALGYAADYLATAAGQRNRNHLAGRIDLGSTDPARQEILFDPQTSGGLLVSLPAASAAAALSELKQAEAGAAIIGLVTERADFPVVIL